MEKFQKLNRDEMKNIIGGDDGTPSDGLGGGYSYCSNTCNSHADCVGTFCSVCLGSQFGFYCANFY